MFIQPCVFPSFWLIYPINILEMTLPIGCYFYGIITDIYISMITLTNMYLRSVSTVNVTFLDVDN